MTILYDISLRLYKLLVIMASPFNSKAALWYNGRKDIFSRIEDAIGSTDNIVWFHCASLGEFEQGRPLIETYKKERPNDKILLTFFSPSGYEVRKNYEGADFIFYLPIDTQSNANRFVKIVKPKVAIFIKYEFWRNYLSALKISGAKVYIASAIFRDSQLFFKPYAKAYRKVLTYFDCIFVQNNHSKTLLESIGIDNVIVSGDTRFDRVYKIASTAAKIDSIAAFTNESKVLIAGSTWEKDDEIIVSLIQKHKDIKFIIAPHEIGQAKIERLQDKISSMGRNCCRYTQGINTDNDVVIIDTIGILSSVYQYGDFAYIGGGFGGGIHNTLEAATFGMPILFGPNYKNFKEAVDLVNLGAAFEIKNAENCDATFTKMLDDNQTYKNSALASKRYVSENIGACQKIISKIM